MSTNKSPFFDPLLTTTTTNITDDDTANNILLATPLNNSSMTTSLTTTTTTNKQQQQQQLTASKNAQLEANANALKARMDAIKSQNLERKQSSSMTTSQINSITNITDEEMLSSSSSNNNNSNSGAAQAAAAQINSNNQSEQLSKLIAENQAYKERERAYVEQIEAIEEENEKFRLVAVEFERIFHQLIREKDESELKMKQEIFELTRERDQAQEDVIGVERAFNDLHRRFEKLKTKVEEFKTV